MQYFEDTSVEMENFLIQEMRRWPAWKKADYVQTLIQSAETMALSGLRIRYPGADEKELHLYLAALRLPPKIMKEIFHWDIEEKGL